MDPQITLEKLSRNSEFLKTWNRSIVRCQRNLLVRRATPIAIPEPSPGASYHLSSARSDEGARQLHVALWKNDPSDKVFKDLKNKTRNELEHLSSGVPLAIGLERECIRMLDRAVENYRLLHKRTATFVVQYERRRELLRRKPRDPRAFPRGLKPRRSGR